MHDIHADVVVRSERAHSDVGKRYFCVRMRIGSSTKIILMHTRTDRIRYTCVYDTRGIGPSGKIADVLTQKLVLVVIACSISGASESALTDALVFCRQSCHVLLDRGWRILTGLKFEEQRICIRFSIESSNRWRRRLSTIYENIVKIGETVRCD